MPRSSPRSRSTLHAQTPNAHLGQLHNSAFERNLSYRLSMLHFLLGRATFEIHDAEGLTTHQWKVMSVICQFAPIPATSMQAWLTLDKSAISRAVRSLVERGLVERLMHGSDGRAVDLVPTRAGMAVNARIMRHITSLQKSLFASVPASDIDALFRTIDHLERELRERPAGDGA